MISKENYKALEAEFGNVASWAIWRKPDGAPKAGMGDVSIFDNPSILEELNPKYVYVALNGSTTEDGYMDYPHPWMNFHSDSPSAQDYKLRYALYETPYWGGYLTDAIKYFPEKHSENVAIYIKNNPSVAIENMELLKKELSYLDENPVIVAIGGQTYNILKKYLGKQYTIKKIMHYAAYVNPDAYRENTIQELSR